MLTYGDGVADIDLAALLRFHKPRQTGHGHDRPPAGAFRRIAFDGDRVSDSPKSRRPAKAGSTAGIFVLNRRCSTTSTAMTRSGSASRSNSSPRTAN